MSPGRRMSTWLAGRNTGTPMSTSSPPLIFRVQVYEANLSAAIGYDKIDAIIYGIPDEEKPFLKPAKYPPTSDFDAQISNNPARDRVRRAKTAMKKR